eukprot:5113-Pelagococcus_subviridis.AAC.1
MERPSVWRRGPGREQAAARDAQVQAGRDHEGVRPTHHSFLNVLIHRRRRSSSQSFATICSRAEEEIMKAYGTLIDRALNHATICSPRALESHQISRRVFALPSPRLRRDSLAPSAAACVGEAIGQSNVLPVKR